MGMFIPEDKNYDESLRQTGFNRYKQLMGRHWTDWIWLNFLTILGALPLAAGIILSLLYSSLVLLIPCSLVGGAIFGPFLAGIYDHLLRTMRDDFMPWKKSYRRSWKQNLRGSLVPGAILGFVVGIYCFLGMLLWVSQGKASVATILLFLCSALILLPMFQLYFTQLVLFEQSPLTRIRNSILFLLLNMGRCLLTGILMILYITIYVLFAPWTLLLLPIAGFWYILFLNEILIYDRLNESFRIEEQIQQQEIQP